MANVIRSNHILQLKFKYFDKYIAAEVSPAAQELSQEETELTAAMKIQPKSFKKDLPASLTPDTGKDGC